MKYLLYTLLLFTISSCFRNADTHAIPTEKETTQIKEDSPPPPPPPPSNAPDEVFKIVEEMPRFPGCENQKLDNIKLSNCSKEKMLEYIYDNLKYPKSAKAKKIEGMSIVQFNIEKNGMLNNIRVVRDPGSGTGEAAADVIHKMNKDGIRWVPGKQRGRAVIVEYTLPIKFALRKK